MCFSAEFVHWVAESNRPFQIVNNHGFHSLMKTGRPEYHIPSVETLSCDVKNVFVRVREHIARMLRVSYIYNTRLPMYSPLIHRNMTANSTSPPMPGPHLITRHTLQ